MLCLHISFFRVIKYTDPGSVLCSILIGKYVKLSVGTQSCCTLNILRHQGICLLGLHFNFLY